MCTRPQPIDASSCAGGMRCIPPSDFHIVSLTNYVASKACKSVWLSVCVCVSKAILGGPSSASVCVTPFRSLLSSEVSYVAD